MKSQILLTLGLGIGCLFSHAILGQVGTNQNVVNPNTATVQKLSAIDGITKNIANEMLKKRPFLNMTQLNNFLSDKLSNEQIAKIYKKLFVPINLNKTTRKEILFVPGVGNRMAHEFEEYRPYKSILQFRREIGKYVNDSEVARLEQFVFVPINLNEASDEAILSIPGLGNRMLREFKEYRPYKNMEQFRREIGKYVDDKEVARLERYVTLK